MRRFDTGAPAPQGRERSRRVVRQLPPRRAAPQAGLEQLALEHELLRQSIEEPIEQLLVLANLRRRGVPRDRHQLIKRALRKPCAVPGDVFVTRHPAERALDAITAAVHAVDNPAENPHVFAEARPDELAVFILAEPVDPKYPRRIGQSAPE